VSWLLWLILLLQLGVSVVLALHLRDQLNPDAVAYGRAAQLWLHGDAHLALNATWGVLCAWLGVPGIAMGLEPPDALRTAQIAMALLSTMATWWLVACFDLRASVRVMLVFTASLYAAAASTEVLASDASFVATFIWMCWVLLSPSERIVGVSRATLAGMLAGLSFLARPSGLPIGIGVAVGTELMRRGDEATLSHRLSRLLIGWTCVALPWIAALSLHYGALTLTHSGPLVHDAVGPRSVHPWNLPSFTTLHRPPDGRITTWEDPGLLRDPSSDWSVFESGAAAAHQLALIRDNTSAIIASLTALDGSGLALISLVTIPLLSWRKPRPASAWREHWLLLPFLVFVAVFVPLHVEDRYLWPIMPIALLALGLFATRLCEWVRLATHRRTLRGVLTTVLELLVLGAPLMLTLERIVRLLAAPPRQERRLAREWMGALRPTNVTGPVVSWSPYAVKALDPEGLYLAWQLGQPWLGNIATDGHDADTALALGARILVVKMPFDGVLPSWLDAGWKSVRVSDVHDITLRDGRYILLAYE
jgi:hypothetical protein